MLVGSAVLAGDQRVVLVGPPAHPTVTRMRDELELLGLRVEVVPPSPEIRDLAGVARARGAAAAARIEDGPPEIAVWVEPSQPAAQAETPRELRISESLEGRPEPGLLALRAIELLRARLIPVPASVPDAGSASSEAVATEPPAAAQPPAAVTPQALPAAPAAPDGSGPAARNTVASPQVSSSAGAGPARERSTPQAVAAQPSRPIISLFAAPALLMSPGGVPVAPEVRLGALWNPWSRLGLEAVVSIPTVASAVAAAEGTIHLRTLIVGGGIHTRLFDPTAHLALRAGLGMAAVWLSFEGDAAAPWVGVKDSRWAAAPYAMLVLSYRLNATIGLRGDVLGGVVAPRPVLRVAGHEVASFGEPAVLVCAGAEVQL